VLNKVLFADHEVPLNIASGTGLGRVGVTGEGELGLAPAPQFRFINEPLILVTELLAPMFNAVPYNEVFAIELNAKDAPPAKLALPMVLKVNDKSLLILAAITALALKLP
jgi:hypothetical protein